MASLLPGALAEIPALTAGKQGPGCCQLADPGWQDERRSNIELVPSPWLLPHRCSSCITLQLDVVLASAQFIESFSVSPGHSLMAVCPSLVARGCKSG